MIKYCIIDFGDIDLKKGKAKVRVLCNDCYSNYWVNSSRVFRGKKLLKKHFVKLFDTRKDANIYIVEHCYEHGISYEVEE